MNEVNIGGREDGIKIKRIRLVEHLLPYPELRPDTVCDSSGDCWYLAPDGDTRCESTNGQAVDSDQCEAAVSALAMSTGTEPNSGIKKCIVPGDKCNSGWNHAPGGCSAQRDTWTPHYYESDGRYHASGDGYSLVCIDTTASADVKRWKQQVISAHQELHSETGCDVHGNCWYLNPAGDRSCTRGQLVGQDQCEEAVSAIAKTSGEKPSGGIKQCIVPANSCNSGWNHVPQGCSAQRGSWIPHFRSGGPNPKPRDSQEYRLVCTDATANYFPIETCRFAVAHQGQPQLQDRVLREMCHATSEDRCSVKDKESHRLHGIACKWTASRGCEISAQELPCKANTVEDANRPAE